MAPDAHLINLRVLDDQGVGRVSDVIDAIDWAIDNKDRYAIRILNLSLGAPVDESYVDPWTGDPIVWNPETRVLSLPISAAGMFRYEPVRWRVGADD